MRVLKFRRGFATNSSSSHSIILAGSYTGPVQDPSWEDGYGWEWFLLTEEDEKLRYMMAQVLHAAGANPHWRDGLSKDQERTRKRLEKMMGTAVADDAYVDHQSTMHFPCNLDGTPALEFMVDMAKAIARDDTVHVRGGNDNSEPPGCIHSYDRDEACNCGGVPHPLVAKAPFGDYSYRWGSQNVIRKSGNIWVVYNPRNGTKVHLDLNGPEISSPSDTYRPQYPELVDLKITDYCDKGCGFCYQGSSPQGRHAPTSRIFNWMQSCKEAGVLEVAIGGGEPTAHPDFLEILEEAGKHFVAVSFSTRNYKWLRKKTTCHPIAQKVSAVGFSVSDAADVKQVQRYWKKTLVEEVDGWRDYEETRFPFTPGCVFHAIPELLDGKQMKGIMDALQYGDTILLLGHKSTGRGATVHRPAGGMEHIEGQFKHWKKSQWMPKTIAVDTAFADKHSKLIEGLGVHERFFYKDEGRFSLYYDAVENKYGPSSFHVDALKDATPAIERRMGSAARSALPVQEMFDSISPIKASLG